MADVKAGVILRTKFIQPAAPSAPKVKIFRNYVDYIDREEAVRNRALPSYNAFSGYNDYMGNPEKTTALFTEYQDSLTPEEKQELKRAFATAEKNKSPMWQHVISFDNRWLAQNGMYDPNTHTLDEFKLKEAVRASMRALTKAEKMDGTSVWSASIHYNTDNIHVHIAMVEPHPTRKSKENQNGEREIRGKMKQSSIRAAKSAVVSQILGQQPEIQQIHQLRDRILKKRKDVHLMDDERMANKLHLLYEALPQNKQFWNYNSNQIHKLKPVIDDLVSDYLKTYHPEEFEEYKRLLAIQAKKYRTAYGTPKDARQLNQYEENKIKDLYARLGNTILKELRDFDKQQKQEFYRHANAKRATGNSGNSSGTSSSSARPESHAPRPENEPQIPSPTAPRPIESRAFSRRQTVCSRKLVNDLKQALKSDWENIKNQQIYEQMQRESQRSGSDFER